MQETYNDIWRKMAGRVRLHLSADSFQRWFAAIELVQADEIALTFKVPNSIYKFWIESNFLTVLKRRGRVRAHESERDQIRCR
jgi:chromosomal replication initiation ATPase DnaA